MYLHENKVPMNKKYFIELVTKYLANEATLDEKKALENLLLDSKYKELFNWLSDKWHRESKSDVTFNFSEGVDELYSKIKKHDSSFSWNNRRKKKSGHYLSPLKIAASIALFVFVSTASLYVTGFFEKPEQVIVMNEKVTKAGQKSVLTLFDGTKIFLNANSKLRYPTHFGETSREVYLDGEAYFEVVHKDKKPFIVHSLDFSVLVLGTKFNVQAFPDEKDVKISLVDGKVKVSGESISENNKAIYLEPQQQLVYSKISKQSTIQKFETIKEIGWKDNTYIFDNEPLVNVLRKLERTFAVDFKLADKKRNIKLTADFKNESFWTVVKTIKSVTKLDYNLKLKEREIIGVEFY